MKTLTIPEPAADLLARTHRIADAVRQAADHGDHVTADQFTAGLAALELRLIKWIAGAGVAVTGAVVGLLRLLD